MEVEHFLRQEEFELLLKAARDERERCIPDPVGVPGQLLQEGSSPGT